jgi:hypothetical protein
MMSGTAGRDLVSGYRLTADEIREPESAATWIACETWYPFVSRTQRMSSTAARSDIRCNGLFDGRQLI